MITQSETFTFGTSPGQYPAGSFIQDSLFKNAVLDFYIWNDVAYSSGASISDSRLNLGGTNVFSNGDTLFAQVKK